MENKIADNERARQFMPFSPLKGYYDLVKSVEKKIVAKKDLSEESAQEISFKLSQIEKGMMITVVHYCNGQYVSTTGMVSKVDMIERKIVIVKMSINIDDIIEISGKDIKEFEEE